MFGPIDAGGFVYPVCIDGDNPSEIVERGITRRDWLAGMAMSGIVSAGSASKDSMHPVTALEVARSAYHIADLMIRLSRDDAAIPVEAPEAVTTG